MRWINEKEIALDEKHLDDQKGPQLILYRHFINQKKQFGCNGFISNAVHLPQE